MPEFWKIQSKWTSAPASGFARNTALVNSAPGTTIASQARADPSMIGNRNQNTWAGVRKIEESEVKSRSLLLVLERGALDQAKLDILDKVIKAAKARKPYPVEVIVEYL